MTSIGTKLYTWRNGERVGEDEYGNVYYTEKKPRDPARPKRWVVYADDRDVEASLVPAAWHGWLHGYAENPPSDSDPKWAWQKPHKPNLTGTPDAYRPPGHDARGGERAPASGDYEAWSPGD